MCSLVPGTYYMFNKNLSKYDTAYINIASCTKRLTWYDKQVCPNSVPNLVPLKEMIVHFHTIPLARALSPGHHFLQGRMGNVGVNWTRAYIIKRKEKEILRES